MKHAWAVRSEAEYYKTDYARCLNDYPTKHTKHVHINMYLSLWYNMYIHILDLETYLKFL